MPTRVIHYFRLRISPAYRAEQLRHKAFLLTGNPDSVIPLRYCNLPPLMGESVQRWITSLPTR